MIDVWDTEIFKQMTLRQWKFVYVFFPDTGNTLISVFGRNLKKDRLFKEVKFKQVKFKEYGVKRCDSPERFSFVAQFKWGEKPPKPPCTKCF